MRLHSPRRAQLVCLALVLVVWCSLGRGAAASLTSPGRYIVGKALDNGGNAAVRVCFAVDDLKKNSACDYDLHVKQVRDEEQNFHGEDQDEVGAAKNQALDSFEKCSQGQTVRWVVRLSQKEEKQIDFGEGAKDAVMWVLEQGPIDYGSKGGSPLDLSFLSRAMAKEVLRQATHFQVAEQLEPCKTNGKNTNKAAFVKLAGEHLAPFWDAGFFHGDLKADNVMCRKGRPVLIDFDFVYRAADRVKPLPQAGNGCYDTTSGTTSPSFAQVQAYARQMDLLALQASLLCKNCNCQGVCEKFKEKPFQDAGWVQCDEVPKQ